MPKKKMIFYAIIIVTMFLATGFMIYKNYKLTAPGSNGKISDVSPIKDFEDIGLSEGGNKEIERDADESKKFGIDIFTDAKFRALKSNTLKALNLVVGKENPFEPKER